MLKNPLEVQLKISKCTLSCLRMVCGAVTEGGFPCEWLAMMLCCLHLFLSSDPILPHAQAPTKQDIIYMLKIRLYYLVFDQ